MLRGFLNHLKFWDKTDAKAVEDDIKNGIESFASGQNMDGAIETEVDETMLSMDPTYSALQHTYMGYGQSSFGSTADQINSYRRLMGITEVENAVDDIINQAIVHEGNDPVVQIDLSKTKFKDPTKKKIQEEFDNILRLLKFQRNSTSIFRSWYVDSRIYFHNIVDPKNPKKGIIELRQLDPRNLRLVRENIVKEENGIKVVKGTREYFIYNTGDSGYTLGGRTFTNNTNLKIPYSAITFAHSGIYEECSKNKNLIGYLHRAIKPANQMKLLEDSVIIYRVSRAPERRVFYIDTGRLPNKKAEATMRSIMNGLKNTATYDPSTGTISNRKNSLAMNEDYWLQRRDGKAVTEVSSLPGASGMNEIEDLKWFYNKLYMALRIPISRIPNESGGISFGMGSEITRDELNFMSFVRTLQNNIEPIFITPLKYNLVLKGILTEEEWHDNSEDVHVVFKEDSMYVEAKELEAMDRRVAVLNNAEPIIGKMISHKTAMMKFLRMSEEEIEEEIKLIQEEEKHPVFGSSESEDDDDDF
mgnify:FL=1